MRKALASMSGPIDRWVASPIHLVTGLSMPSWSCANWAFLPSIATGTPSRSTITGTEELWASARPIITFGVAARLTVTTPGRPLTRA